MLARELCDLKNLQNDECVAGSESCFIVGRFLCLSPSGFRSDTAGWEKEGQQAEMLYASSWLVQVRISVDCWNRGTATHCLVFTVQQGPYATIQTQAAASPPAHWGCWREDPCHGTLWLSAQRALWFSIKESRGIPDPGEVWYSLVEGKRPLGVRLVAWSLSNTSSSIPYRLLKHEEGCSLA